jgi:PleD family two-component response regulator
MGSLANMRKRIKSLISSDNHRLAYPNVLNHEDFMNLLRRESNRADRNNRSFSVIVFHPDVKMDKVHQYTDLLTTLKKRVRLYDSIGWFDAESIGVLLPETSKDNAYKLGGEIFGKLQKGVTYEIL